MAAPAGNKYWELSSEHGRPKLISHPDILWGWFKDYVKFVKDNPLLVQDFVGKDGDEVYRKKEKPLTMEGFELYVAEQGGPWQLDQYFSNKNGSYEEFFAICSRVRAAIRHDQIQGGMAGIYNTSITQRLNNLTEKTETTLKLPEKTVDLSMLSDEALKELENAGKFNEGKE